MQPVDGLCLGLRKTHMMTIVDVAELQGCSPYQFVAHKPTSFINGKLYASLVTKSSSINLNIL